MFSLISNLKVFFFLAVITRYISTQIKMDAVFIFQQEFYFVCNGHLFLEDHLMGELSLAEAEDVLHISLQHGGIGVLGNHLQNLLVDGSLKNKDK